jgi:hypothetical protein
LRAELPLAARADLLPVSARAVPRERQVSRPLLMTPLAEALQPVRVSELKQELPWVCFPALAKGVASERQRLARAAGGARRAG